MKKVVQSAQVAHLWFNTSQDEAYTPTRNFSFRGPKIYSYSTCIAMLVYLKSVKTVLLNNRNYSVTTSGHKTDIHRAIGWQSETPVFQVANCEAERPSEHKANFEDYQARLIALYKKHDKARTYKDMYARDIVNLTNEANTYAKIFGVRRKITAKNIEEMKASQARAEKREALRRKKHDEAMKVKAAEGLAQWLAGGDYRLGFNTVEVHLRKVGETCIQTSKGAEIPYNAGKRLFMDVLDVRQSGITKYPQGLSVGQFQVSEIAPDYIRAGCHLIKWKQIEAFAKSENWSFTPPIVSSDTIANTPELSPA